MIDLIQATLMETEHFFNKHICPIAVPIIDLDDMCPSTDTSLNWLVEDVSDLWPTVKPAFEGRLPLKRACLNNKARNPVIVEALPAEFILATDSRLRSRFPQEQSLFWFREPYATVVLVTCEVT